MAYFIIQCKQIYDKFVKDEITVYAAQASFFTVLSSFPFIILLLSIIQLMPAVSQADLLDVLKALLPAKVDPLVESVIQDLYSTSPAAILSVTTIVTLWSASRGILGIERGLNRILGCSKRRNYVISRLISSGYTVIFILVWALTLSLLVFGSVVQSVLLAHIPLLRRFSPYLISLRALLALAVLIAFFTVLYTYLPYDKLRIRQQLPGAVFSTAGWILSSWGFSIYFSHFSSYSAMYGSLAAVVILMLWLYFCLCILFLGAEINHHLAQKHWFLR